MARVSTASMINELFITDKPYIALEGGPGFDFEWEPVHVKYVIDAWKAGTCLLQISGCLGRDPDELAILIIDLTRCGIIRERPGAIYGKG